MRCSAQSQAPPGKLGELVQEIQVALLGILGLALATVVAGPALTTPFLQTTVERDSRLFELGCQISEPSEAHADGTSMMEMSERHCSSACAGGDGVNVGGPFNWAPDEEILDEVLDEEEHEVEVWG